MRPLLIPPSAAIHLSDKFIASIKALKDATALRILMAFCSEASSVVWRAFCCLSLGQQLEMSLRLRISFGLLQRCCRSCSHHVPYDAWRVSRTVPKYVIGLRKMFLRRLVSAKTFTVSKSERRRNKYSNIWKIHADTEEKESHRNNNET